mgnify:CR=1 FL=1
MTTTTKMMKWHDNNGGGDNDDDDNNKDNNGGGDNDESDNDKDDISTTLIEEDVDDDDDVGEESDTKDYNKMFMNWTISKYHQVLEFCIWVWLHAFLCNIYEVLTWTCYNVCLIRHIVLMLRPVDTKVWLL